MDNIAIYGAGGFGREMLVMIDQINEKKKQWNVIGFFDDAKKPGSAIEQLTVLGDINELNAGRAALSVVIAVADPQQRKKIVSAIKNPLISFPSLIHPAANTGSHENVFGKGTLITAGVICTTQIVLNEFVIINLASTIGHDVSIGSFTTIMPGCHISGNVQVGEGVLLGTGSSVLQNLTIGERAKVGAGAVVVKNVPDSVTVLGVPARQKS